MMNFDIGGGEFVVCMKSTHARSNVDGYSMVFFGIHGDFWELWGITEEHEKVFLQRFETKEDACEAFKHFASGLKDFAETSKEPEYSFENIKW